MSLGYCYSCQNRTPKASTFFRCNRCQRVVCAHCLSKTGGFKCPDCPHGVREKVSD